MLPREKSRAKGNVRKPPVKLAYARPAPPTSNSALTARASASLPALPPPPKTPPAPRSCVSGAGRADCDASPNVWPGRSL